MDTRPRNVADEYKDKVISMDDKPNLGFNVILFNIKRNLNIGNMIRTAELTGAKCVYIIGRRNFDRRATVGSQNYINMEFCVVDDDVKACRDTLDEETYVSPEFFMSFIREKGLTPIFVEQHAKSVKMSQEVLKNFVELPNPSFVFGTEDKGIPKSILDTTEYPIMQLHQAGVGRSFNVANACSIVCYNVMSAILEYI